MKNTTYWKKWIAAAGMRAVKSVAQTAIATIGYGHSFDTSITAGTVWTKQQAEAALKKDLQKFAACKTLADYPAKMVELWGSATRYKTGLINRRKAEAALFVEPVGGSAVCGAGAADLPRPCPDAPQGLQGR